MGPQVITNFCIIDLFVIKEILETYTVQIYINNKDRAKDEDENNTRLQTKT